MDGIGPQPGASQIVGGASLPANPTVRQVFVVPGIGMYCCLSDGNWSLLDSVTTGEVTGSSVPGRVAFWNGTTNITGDADFTFVTDTLTVTKLGATTLTGTISGGGNEINNVSIGASSPGAGAFTGVTGSGLTLTNTNTKLAINTTNTTGGIEWQESTVAKAQLVISGGDTYFDWYGTLNLRTGVSGTLRASLTTAGLFTTTQLAVSGIGSDATHTDTTVCQDTTSHQFFAGSGAAGICLGTSAARFKEGWEYLTSSVMEQVMALKVGTFRYKDGYGDSGSRHQIGVLAEDVAESMPEMVVADVDGQPMQVDYMGLLLKLIPAFQEQQYMIQMLSARLETLAGAR